MCVFFKAILIVVTVAFIQVSGLDPQNFRVSLSLTKFHLKGIQVGKSARRVEQTGASHLQLVGVASLTMRDLSSSDHLGLFLKA